MYNDYNEYEDNDASLLNNNYCDQVERNADAQIKSDAQEAINTVNTKSKFEQAFDSHIAENIQQQEITMLSFNEYIELIKTATTVKQINEICEIIDYFGSQNENFMSTNDGLDLANISRKMRHKIILNKFKSIQ